MIWLKGLDYSAFRWSLDMHQRTSTRRLHHLSNVPPFPPGRRTRLTLVLMDAGVIFRDAINVRPLSEPPATRCHRTILPRAADLH